MSMKEGNEIGLKAQEPDLIICVDFGTTATAVVYRHNKHTSFMRWAEMSKTPTVLLYSNKDGQHKKPIAWGQEAEDALAPETLSNSLFNDANAASGRASESIDMETNHYEKREWFKVLLQRSYLELQQEFSETSLENVKRWTTDFLIYIYTSIKRHLSSTVGEWEHMNLVVCFGVPDSWVLGERDALFSFKDCIEAARIATGISYHPIRIETEAEAAAHYFAETQGESSDRKGQKTLVFDAGGGTIDIAVCQTHVVYGGSKVQSTNAIGSIVGVCGANYLMRLEKCFMDMIRRGSPSTQSALPWRKVQLYIRQSLKRRGSPHPTKEITLKLYGKKSEFNLQDDEAAGIRHDCITLGKDEVTRCSEKLCEDIVRALSSRLENQRYAELSHIDQICIAGGFGATPIFMDAMKIWKERSTNHWIRSAAIMRSKDPRLEVVLGLAWLTSKSYGFSGCTFSVESASNPPAHLTFLAGERKQLFKKRFECDKNATLTIKCKRSSRRDADGVRVNPVYDLCTIAAPRSKYRLWTKQRELQGYVTPDEFVLQDQVLASEEAQSS